MAKLTASERVKFGDMLDNLLIVCGMRMMSTTEISDQAGITCQVFALTENIPAEDPEIMQEVGDMLAERINAILAGEAPGFQAVVTAFEPENPFRHGYTAPTRIPQC